MKVITQTSVTGKQVVEAARRYIGAPFKLHGRDKRGIDCVGLVLAVARDFGLEVDVSNYDLTGMKFQTAERLFLDHGFVQISPEQVRIGDVQTARNLTAGVASGVAVVSGTGGPAMFAGVSSIIFCDTTGGFSMPRRRVVEDRVSSLDLAMANAAGLSAEVITRVLRFYRYPFVAQ